MALRWVIAGTQRRSPMSVDVHPGLHAGAHDIQVATDEQFEHDATWTETVVTVVATIVTIAFVSFVAAVMAMA
jgi:hypothetical protein